MTDDKKLLPPPVGPDGPLPRFTDFRGQGPGLSMILDRRDPYTEAICVCTKENAARIVEALNAFEACNAPDERTKIVRYLECEATEYEYSTTSAVEAIDHLADSIRRGEHLKADR